MSMTLTSHAKGNVIIVDTSGKMTFGEGTSALRAKVRELAEGGYLRILLNMAEVTSIDSSGLGELVAAHRTATTAGGELKLLNLAVRARHLLQITRLSTVFETFDDEAVAIASFPVAKPR